MAESTTPVASTSSTGRLLSLDALRGFDMFWIMGADSLGHALGKVATGSAALALVQQLDHVPWEGFRFYDLIFPLFIFIAGVSSVFSLDKLAGTEGREVALARVLKRTFLLYLLGIFYYGGIERGLDQVRLLGVLQRIALCYGFTGICVIFLRPKSWIAIVGILLLGYWALMAFVPVPGIGAGQFEEGKNLANWVDAEYLPWRKWDGDHDPEGLLSTLPAFATCLIGALAGHFLKYNTTLSPTAAAFRLVFFGVASLGLGWLWASSLLGPLQFPVIKKLWTSSYVLVAAGWSLMLLAVFYYVIDIRRWRGWCWPFVWVGTNAIAIYLAGNLLDFDRIAARLVGGPVSAWMDAVLGPGYGGVLVALAGILLSFWFARILYRRGLFLRL